MPKEFQTGESMTLEEFEAASLEHRRRTARADFEDACITLRRRVVSGDIGESESSDEIELLKIQFGIEE